MYYTCSTICSDANGDGYKTRLLWGYVTLEQYGMTRLHGGYWTTCDCWRVCYDRQIARHIDCRQTYEYMPVGSYAN